MLHAKVTLTFLSFNFHLYSIERIHWGGGREVAPKEQRSSRADQRQGTVRALGHWSLRHGIQRFFRQILLDVFKTREVACRRRYW